MHQEPNVFYGTLAGDRDCTSYNLILQTTLGYDGDVFTGASTDPADTMCHTHLISKVGF